eukprot:TRINITY_DN65774_c0_g1_i1.p1 TRINITY_DN65774_c0_g1~~TRINITY_DN65774_c0_g1_i1.p1  ORF type:complete len:374 (+),score=59.54 TRINITY_DN65774_c0_g1_i1:81-1202(+)
MADEHGRSEMVGVLPPFKATISVVFPDEPHINKEKRDTHFSVFVGEGELQLVLLRCLTSLLKKVMLNLPEDNMKTALGVVKRLQAMKILASTGSAADSFLLQAGKAKDHLHELFPKSRVSLPDGYRHASEKCLPVTSEEPQAEYSVPSGESCSLTRNLGSSASQPADQKCGTEDKAGALEAEDDPIRIRRAAKNRCTLDAFRMRDPSDQLKACVKLAVERARSKDSAHPDLQNKVCTDPAALALRSKDSAHPHLQNRVCTDSAARPRRSRKNLHSRSLYSSEPLYPLPEEDSEGQSRHLPASIDDAQPASEEFAVGDDILAVRAPHKAGDIHSTPGDVHSIPGSYVVCCPKDVLGASQKISEVAEYFKGLSVE